MRSITFRNVTVEETPRTLDFEDKDEIVFDEVTFLTPLDKIDIFNRNPDITNPSFTMTRSTLYNDVNVEKNGLKPPTSITQIVAENAQEPGKDCQSVFMGSVIIEDNDLGFLTKEAIKVMGGAKLSFKRNRIQFIDREAIKVAIELIL